MAEERSILQIVRRWLNQHRLLSATASLLLVLLIAGGSILWVVSHPAPPPRGQECGTIINRSGHTVANGEASFQAEDCFWHAYQQCRAATITYGFMGIDAGSQNVFTIEKSNDNCLIFDDEQSYSLVRSSHSTSTCASMSKQTDGLHISGCSDGSTFIIPPVTVIDCGSVGSPGVNDKPMVVENCFWHAYQQCHPADLTYAMMNGNNLVYRLFEIDQRCVITDKLVMSTCSGLTQQSDGLHFASCGVDGDVTVPA